MSSYNVDNDITVEFYYKSASYKSPVTGETVRIDIKRVYADQQVSKTFPYWERHEIIISDKGVEYDKNELFDFKITNTMSTEEEKSTEVQTLPEVTTPEVTFEGIILDEKEPVKFTPQLIRTKSADLLLLTIKDIFDEAGLKAVKSAKMKIVKTRTAIQAIEKVEKDKLKVRHDAEKKELTDYAATLYAACTEGENILQARITAHETDKAAAAKKLADDLKEKTEGRNQKMYDLGMKFNGTGFMEYGKYIGQDVLHAMSDEKYAELLVEIEGLSMEQGTTGKVAEPAAVPDPREQSNHATQRSPGFAGGWAPRTTVLHQKEATNIDRVYDTAIYERALPELGARIVITNGMIEAEPDAIVANDRIKESSYYLQVVR